MTRLAHRACQLEIAPRAKTEISARGLLAPRRGFKARPPLLQGHTAQPQRAPSCASKSPTTAPVSPRSSSSPASSSSPSPGSGRATTPSAWPRAGWGWPSCAPSWWAASEAQWDCEVGRILAPSSLPTSPSGAAGARVSSTGQQEPTQAATTAIEQCCCRGWTPARCHSGASLLGCRACLQATSVRWRRPGTARPASACPRASGMPRRPLRSGLSLAPRPSQVAASPRTASACRPQPHSIRACSDSPQLPRSLPHLRLPRMTPLRLAPRPSGRAPRRRRDCRSAAVRLAKRAQDRTNPRCCTAF
mmetsp:Transcript_4609/g.19635  ORF Transcript_4609/g.19635 Transcript_4609/m.19635 type:complete len:304 (+) Transcript_4609:182-1093(+)